ncbi:hypothetical protein [Lentzea sp. NPDC059081]|uniref:hypothetical protein n=1 Tax=Lentzea sp. NPDC059081 TaxID=3346719 RepID=UPI00368FA1D6
MARFEKVLPLLTDLGYDRYVVSAGDVGCDVAEVLAAEHPDAVAALHLTDVSQHRFRIDPPTGLSPAEQEYVRYGQRWQDEEGGYMHEQRTKPHTLAVALGDSPAGLAAWLVEKLRTWTDCAGDVTTVFTRDELLTWVTAYWVSGAIGTSFTPHAESGPGPQTPITAPTAFTIFPKDLVNAPRCPSPDPCDRRTHLATALPGPVDRFAVNGTTHRTEVPASVDGRSSLLVR